jgi:phytoene dehydrogenase-like protein
MNTIFNMLDGKYGSGKLKCQYKELPIFHSYMQVSFGINSDLSQEHQFIVYRFNKPIIIGDSKIDNIRIRHYCFNEHFAPKGKSSLVVTFNSDYNYWNRLYTQDLNQYYSEKERVKDELIDVLDKRFEGIGDQIEMVDIATPKTFERYSGNRNGSAEGWGVTQKTLTASFQYTLKGLDNFYMAGHWTNINGGIMTASITARQVAQLICDKESVRFQGGNDL